MLDRQETTDAALGILFFSVCCIPALVVALLLFACLANVLKIPLVVVETTIQPATRTLERDLPPALFFDSRDPKHPTLHQPEELPLPPVDKETSDEVLPTDPSDPFRDDVPAADPADKSTRLHSATDAYLRTAILQSPESTRIPEIPSPSELLRGRTWKSPDGSTVTAHIGGIGSKQECLERNGRFSISVIDRSNYLLLDNWTGDVYVRPLLKRFENVFTKP